MEAVEGLGREKVDSAELAEHAPVRTVRGEHQVPVVEGDMLAAGVGRAAREVGVVVLQELPGDRGGGGDDNVDETETEVEEGALGAREAREGLVRFRAELWEVAKDRPPPGAWGEGAAALPRCGLREEQENQEWKEDSGEQQQDCAVHCVFSVLDRCSIYGTT